MQAINVEAVRDRGLALLGARADLSVAKLAAHSALSQSVITHFFNGDGQRTAATARAVGTVLDLVERGEILAPGGGNAQVISEASEPAKRVTRSKNTYTTDTVRRVAKVLEYCADEAAIGVVTGTYGAGKTEAVRIWRRRQQRIATVVYEFEEFSARNKVEFVGALAELLGVDAVAGSQYGGTTFRRVVEALRQKPVMLILDQCEGLSVPVFQVIRQIWDRTNDAGVAIVLLAAPVLLSRMSSSQAKDLGALTSRVGVWGTLRGISREEMADIVKREGFTQVDEDAFDLWWKGCGGSMRRLMRSMDMLRVKWAGKRVTEKVVIDVAGMLWGMTIGDPRLAAAGEKAS